VSNGFKRAVNPRNFYRILALLMSFGFKNAILLYAIVSQLSWLNLEIVRVTHGFARI
jgi:hypothetical protein